MEVKPLSYYEEHARQILAHYTESPIVIDGVWEKEWDSASWQGDFTVITGEGKANQDTQVALLYDSQNLYIAFLFEKDPTK